MAKIPSGEGLGNRVAEPQGAASIPTGASGEALFSAIGAGLDARQQQMDREAAIRRQEDKEAEAVRKANERARANASMLTAQDRLVELHDDFTEQVKTGKVKRETVDAEWSRIAQEQVSATMEDMPPDHQQAVHAQLTHKTQQLARGVRKAVVQLDQADTLAQINKTLESTQRMHLSNPKGAQELTDATLAELAPAAGLTAEQARAAGQKWKESTRFTAATALVTSARTDNRALDAVAKRLNGEEFADMDPQRKVTLLGQIAGFQASNDTRAEARARRAEAHADRVLKVAEAETNAATMLINSGKTLSPDYIQALTQKTAGTPYAALIPELVKAAPEKAAFGMQPLAVQDAAIMGLRAKLNQAGTDPKTEARVRELEQIRDAAKRDYKEDPLTAALDRGLLERIDPLDTRSMPGVLAGMAQRVEQAQIVSSRVGAPVSPLLRTEAEAVSKLISALPVEQRATAIADLSKAAGPQIASAIGRQIAGKDKALGLAIAMGSDKTTAGRHTSELVLRGAQAVKDRSINTESQSVTGIRAQVAKELGDAVGGDARNDLIEASIYTYYGMQSEGDADVSRAVRLATGGVTERGGRKVLLPYGVPEADFDKKLRALPAEALKTPEVYIDGKPMPAADFIKRVPDAGLVTVGNGRYHVRAGRSLATDAKGNPVVLEVR